MDKQLFNDYIVKLLKSKAMLSIDIINDLLIRFPDINKNTVKSTILRSKLLRSSKPKTFAYNSYAYTLKTNRNYTGLRLTNAPKNLILLCIYSNRCILFWNPFFARKKN